MTRHREISTQLKQLRLESAQLSEQLATEILRDADSLVVRMTDASRYDSLSGPLRDRLRRLAEGLKVELLSINAMRLRSSGRL